MPPRETKLREARHFGRVRAGPEYPNAQEANMYSLDSPVDPAIGSRKSSRWLVASVHPAALSGVLLCLAALRPLTVSADRPDIRVGGDRSAAAATIAPDWGDAALLRDHAVPSGDGGTAAQLVQACCLPDGGCLNMEHMPCVQMGGDPQGPGTLCESAVMACRPLKWAQPPTYSPLSPEPDCFWGWDELSHYGCCQIVADDFLCVTQDPITDIHWWGSYRGWLPSEPPPDAPPFFHIGIWTDVPAGAPIDETCCYCWNPPGTLPPTTCSPNPPDQATCDMWGGGQYQVCTYFPSSRCVNDACEPLSPLPYSHPGTMIHQWIVARQDLHERTVGCDFHPEFPPGDTCFKYDFEIPVADWFQQPPSPIENIYWISISAMYGDVCACSGDVNGDGNVDMFDIPWLADCINGMPIDCSRADINCDDALNQLDVDALTCLINQFPPSVCCPGTIQPPVFPWGWKTREHFFNDDAVVILDPRAPTPPFSEFVDGYPIEQPTGVSWDTAFTLATQRPQACCVNDLAGMFCMDQLPDLCVPQGVPQGSGTACSGTTIACCLPDGTCHDLDPICCDDLGGIPSGIAAACMGDLNGNDVDDACEPVLEACCDPFNGTCANMDPALCAASGRNPQGTGSVCSPALQACCLPAGAVPDCVMADPLCCDDIGGVPSPHGALACVGDVNGNNVNDGCEALVVCEPQGLNPVHPPLYWYDSTHVGYCDFHVRVFDPNPANYAPVFVPANWTFQVHQLLNGEWWASWWDPTTDCRYALFAPFRFAFSNPNPSTWGDWTVTISNTDDPYNQYSDASWYHSTWPDGYGYRVHVPQEQVCEPTPDLTACSGPCTQDPQVCVPKRVRRTAPQPFFPAAAIDTLIPTTGYVIVRSPLGDEATFNIRPDLTPNITRIIRESPTDMGDHREIAAEMIETQLLAEGPGGMMAFIRESPTRASSGRVTGAVSSLSDYPADSFFDVFVEIDIPEMGMFGLWNPEPIPMLATNVTTMPPSCSPTECAAYHSVPMWPGVEMLDASGMPTGFVIVAAEHVPPPPPPDWQVVECACIDPGACHVEPQAGTDPICVGGCPPGQDCVMGVAIIDPGITEYECSCYPMQACCLPDGTCQQLAHNDCVRLGGDPQGPGTDCTSAACSPIKWSQPPTFSPASLHPECFYGWDEISVHGLWQIVADDWLCTTEQPITDIHWWGSYMDWSGVEPPSPPYLVPSAFHIGIWTDFAGGIFSHPDTMIWEWIVPRTELNERPVACDFHPEHHFLEPDSCFRYDFQIPESQWFYQGPVSAVFWISISAMYDGIPCPCNGDVNGDGIVDLFDMIWLTDCINGVPIDCSRADVNCDGSVDPLDIDTLQCLFAHPQDPEFCCPPFTPIYAWGWKTHLPSWNDDAVRITEPTAPRTGIPPMPPFPQYVAGTPISNQEGSWDMSFVLTTQPTPCVTDRDCVIANADVCMCDKCVAGTCVSSPIEFGNVNCAGPPSQVNLDDILCVLAGFGGFHNCPNGDVHPFCTGNGVINLDDILAVRAAFGGFDPCNCQP